MKKGVMIILSLTIVHMAVGMERREDPHYKPLPSQGEVQAGGGNYGALPSASTIQKERAEPAEKRTSDYVDIGSVRPTSSPKPPSPYGRFQGREEPSRGPERTIQAVEREEPEEEDYSLLIKVVKRNMPEEDAPAILYTEGGARGEEIMSRSQEDLRDAMSKMISNIRRLVRVWGSVIIEGKMVELPHPTDETVQCLCGQDARFLKGRNRLLQTNKPWLEEIIKRRKKRVSDDDDDIRDLATIHRQLRSFLALGIQIGANASLIKRILDVEYTRSLNKELFSYLRPKGKYKKASFDAELESCMPEENRFRMEFDSSIRLRTLLRCQGPILHLYRAWNPEMIQEERPLSPMSPGISDLPYAEQVFVRGRRTLIQALDWQGWDDTRIHNPAFAEKLLRVLAKRHLLMEKLVDLGCQKGLSAELIGNLMEINRQRRRNKWDFDEYAKKPFSIDPRTLKEPLSVSKQRIYGFAMKPPAGGYDD